jgi:predicted membrane protein
MATTYEFSLAYALWALGGLVLGLLIGRIFRRTVRVAAVADTAGTGPIVAAVPGIRALKGVGDKFAAALETIGLGSVDSIARLNADEALDADTRLGAFNGRIARDRLVEQAVLLDEGRTTEYTARFGTPG